MKTSSILLIAALFLNACAQEQVDSGSASPLSAPNGTGEATATPSNVALPSATTKSDTALAHDSIAEVVTNDLVVRSMPEVSDASDIHPVLLQDGQLLFVLDGPVRANGYDWYQVVPFELCPECDDTPPADVPPAAIGWSAAGGKDGEVWIAPSDQPCISPEDDPVHWRPGLMALACEGSREIVVEGQLTGCAGVVIGEVTPVWLAEGGCELLPEGFEPVGIGRGPLVFRVPPDGPAVPSAVSHPHLRITGHLDDAAAQNCVASPVTGSPVQPIQIQYPELAVLNCRAAFVATRVEVL